MRRASTVNTAISLPFSAAMDEVERESCPEESRAESPESGKLGGKLNSMLNSMEKNLQNRLWQIEEKLDSLHNYAEQASKDAKAAREREAATGAPQLISAWHGSHSAGDRGRMSSLQRRHVHRVHSNSLQTIPRMSPPSEMSFSRTKSLPMPRLLLAGTNDTRDEPSLPATIDNCKILVPPGQPACMESSHPKMSDELEKFPEQPSVPIPERTCKTPENPVSSIVGTITRTMSLDNVHHRRTSWASSVSSGTAEQLRAKVKAMNQKRTHWQQAIWNFIEETESSKGAHLFSWALDIIVVVNVFFCTSQTTDPPTLQGATPVVLHFLFDIIFALEILTRFVVCPNRWTFFTSGSNWVDIAAAMPLFMNVSACATQDCTQSSGMVEVMVILPVVRLCKLLRRFETFHLLVSAFAVAFEALPVLLYTAAMLVMFFAALIYFAEPRSNLEVLPQSFWLVVCTMSTVGYGDETPITTSGKICTSLLIICSALYMAIPLGIVGGAFSRVWEDRDRLMLIRRTRNRLWQWGYTPKDCLQLFYLYDSTKSGDLDLCEFSEMIQEMRLGIGVERTVNLFKAFDSNGSGKVDDEEFVRALYPKSYHSIYRFRSLMGPEQDLECQSGSGIRAIAEPLDSAPRASPVKDGDDTEDGVAGSESSSSGRVGVKGGDDLDDDSTAP